jgi:hypothetical protein
MVIAQGGPRYIHGHSDICEFQAGEGRAMSFPDSLPWPDTGNEAKKATIDGATMHDLTR